MRYHLKTYGCQMNYSDSERVCAMLEQVGYQPANSEEDADLVIFNTCSIRQKAEDRVLGLMPRMNELKRRRQGMLVGITGCMVQKTSTKHSVEQDSLVSNFEEIDLVFRINELAKLPYLLKELKPDLQYTPPQEVAEGDLRNYFQINPKYTSKFQAFVPIMSGCDKFCAFCIVPYTRGREWARPIPEVAEEVAKLVDNGCNEVTLLGQNVNSYGLSAIDRKNGHFKHITKRSPFAELLHKLDFLQERGLRRVRWTSPHPRDMTDDVIEAVAKLGTQMPYIHMPIQAGNDDVLKRMNRPYTIDRYREIVAYIRKLMPDCAISTDIIVGFCGETAEQFEDTLRLYAEIRWDMAYIAQYSMRRFTLASKMMKDDVPQGEKQRRWRALNEILAECSEEKHKRFVGKTVKVLVERCERGNEKKRTANDGRAQSANRAPRLCSGRSEHFKRTQFLGSPELVGKYVKVRVTDYGPWHLEGEIA